jgi:hypothetical protein
MINGINVNAGIFVKMARPKAIPERNEKVLIDLGYVRDSNAKSMEVRINGNIRESRTTLLVNQLEGMTAKSRAEINPTAGLNLLSPILYIKNVSTIAMLPIIKRGVSNNFSIENELADNTFCGKSIILKIAAKKIWPK